MPTGHFAASQLVTVAAFAVCVQSVMRLPVSKLPAATRQTVHAWLIATRKKNRKRRSNQRFRLPLPSSRGDGIRTHDLCVPNAALYQTEPRLEISKIYHTQSTEQSQVLICFCNRRAPEVFVRCSLASYNGSVLEQKNGSCGQMHPPCYF